MTLNRNLLSEAVRYSLTAGAVGLLALGFAGATAGVVATVVDGESTVGGGSLPGETLPARLLALSSDSPNAVAARLRAQNPPIIARVAGGQLLFDPRTVSEAEDPALLGGIRNTLAG